MKVYLPAARTASALSRSRPLARRATAYAPGVFWREQDALLNQAFRQSSPRYELTNTAEKFQIAVDVPGVKPSDISVNLEKNGQVLTLSGHRERKSDGYQYSSKFAQSFALDEAVDVEKLTANLSNGVLVVTAPKDWSKVEDSIKKIPITENAMEEEPLALDNGEESATANDTALDESTGETNSNAKKEEVVVETVDAEMEEEEPGDTDANKAA